MTSLLAQALPWILFVQTATTGKPDYVLPDATTNVFQVVAVKVPSSSAATTVRAPAHQLIDGSETYEVSAGGAAIFQAQSSQWRILASFSLGGAGSHNFLSATHPDTVAASGRDDSVVVANSSDLWERVSLPNCTDTGGNHINYDTSTNSFSCGTSSGGSANVVEAEVDFGSAGNTTASVAVTGQAWVTGTSKIICAPTLFSTSDRDDGDEDALIEGLTVAVHTRSAGTGWTVMAHPENGVAYGKFKIHCTGS